MGNGDSSQVYIPAGALDASDQGKVSVSIEKSTVQPGGLEGASAGKLASMGVFAQSSGTPLPNGVTAVSDQ